MTRLRFVVACLATAALVLAGCGGDDDDDASPTSTGSDAVGEDEYLDALTDSFTGSESFAASEAEARCAAERVVDEIGADRMQEAGLTVERLESEEEDEGATDLTEAESEIVADALFECLDVAAAFAEGFAPEAGASEAEVACVSERAADLASLRTFVARIIRIGGTAVMDEGEAGDFATVLLDCIDFAPAFAEGFGRELTPEEEQCVNDTLRESDAFRNYLEGSLTGDTIDDEELGRQVGPELAACLPDGDGALDPA
jgi:hypothetical protein